MARSVSLSKRKCGLRRRTVGALYDVDEFGPLSGNKSVLNSGQALALKGVQGLSDLLDQVPGGG